LKDILTNAPILNIVDMNEYFVVCIDAHKEGLNGVPTQEDHVEYYDSRKLKEHERNYATHDIELTTIIHTLKIWRNYLTRMKFELSTNQCSMKHLFGQPTLNARQTR
jgi:hypothetical protein